MVNINLLDNLFLKGLFTEEKRSNLTLTYQAFGQDLANQILSLLIPKGNIPYRLGWAASGSSKVNATIPISLFSQKTSTAKDEAWVWNLGSGKPSQSLFILVEGCMESTPMLWHSSYKNGNIPPHCDCCLNAVESVSHMLPKCP